MNDPKKEAQAPTVEPSPEPLKNEPTPERAREEKQRQSERAEQK